MATTVFFRNLISSDSFLATNSTKLDGSTSGWVPFTLSTTRGGGVVGLTTNTVAGPTSGVDVASGGPPCEFISPPLDQDITIAGTISFNIWASENNMSANVGMMCVVERLDSKGAIISTIGSAEDGVEVAVTTAGLLTWTVDATDTNMLKGDKLRIRVAGNDVGTMASGFSFVFRFDHNVGGADGDSFVTFTETFGFQTTDPTGSTLFLTDTASPVSAGTTEREMWTSRGGGVVNDVTNTAAGWTAGIQVTDTAGGAAVEWYTKPLTAFTLSGLVLANIRALESNAAANASLRCELAICANDGSGAVVWASTAAASPTNTELLTTEAAVIARLAGDDVTVTDGQRLRLRVYVDDSPVNVLVTGHTITTHYNGTSGGASGDSFITLEQTVTEFSSTPTSLTNRRKPNFRGAPRLITRM